MTTRTRELAQHGRPHPQWTGEDGREPLPLKGYAALLGVFSGGMGGLLAWAIRNERLVDGVSLTDTVLIGVASHKLARMASKDRVTTVLRRPATHYGGTDGALPGECDETARRDRGQMLQAVGELFTCPYCISTWSTAALFGVYLADRKLARTIGTFLASVSVAELAQHVYCKIMES